MPIWRKFTAATGLMCVVAAALVPVMSASADVGPVATTTSVVPYSCKGVGFAAGIGTLPTQNVTVTLGAPTTVTPGQAYVVTVDLSPLTLANPGFPLNAPATVGLDPVGGTGTAGGQAVSGNVSFSGNIATVPRSTMTMTPTAAVGSDVRATAGRIRIVVGSTGFECQPTSGATRATIATSVIAATTTTSTTTSTTASTTTVPGSSSTTMPSTTTSTTTTTVPVTAPPPTTTPTTAPPTTATTAPPPTTPTTAPPTTAPPTTPEGPAVSVRSSKTATFSCNIFDSAGTQFNQNPLPPSTVTITMTLPDKVGVGGAVSGLVRFDPGPLNGPIRLPAGTVDFAASVAIAGGSPGTVDATGGPNGAEIAANTASRSPEMPFSFTTTAEAGTSVSLGISKVEVQASSPSELVTRCTPQGAEMNEVASVKVVAGTVAPPAELVAEVSQATAAATAAAGGSTSGDGGFANCDEARAAGRGTIVRTDPAYRERLDADGDGLACERTEVAGASLAATGTTTVPWTVWSVALLLAGAVLIRVGRTRVAPADTASGGPDRE